MADNPDVKSAPNAQSPIDRQKPQQPLPPKPEKPKTILIYESESFKSKTRAP